MLPQTPGGLKLARALLLRQEEPFQQKNSPERRYRGGSAEQHSFTFGQNRGQATHSNNLDVPRGSATQRSFAYGDTHRRRERRLGTLPTLDEVILEGLAKRSATSSPTTPHHKKQGGGPLQVARIEERSESASRSGSPLTKSEKAINWKKAKALMIRSVPTFSGRGAIGEENEVGSESRPGERPGPVAPFRKGGCSEANSATADVPLPPRFWLPIPSNSHSPQNQPSQVTQRHHHQRRASSGNVIDKSPLSLDETIRLGLSKRATSAPVPSQLAFKAASPAKTDMALSEFFQQQLGNNRMPNVRGSGSERSFTFGSLDSRRGHLPRGSATEMTFAYGDAERRMRRDSPGAGADLRTIEEAVIQRFAMRERVQTKIEASRREKDKSIPQSHKKPPLPPRKGPLEPVLACPPEFGAMSPGLSTSSTSSSNNSTQEFSPGSLATSYERKRWYRFLLCGALRA